MIGPAYHQAAKRAVREDISALFGMTTGAALYALVGWCGVALGACIVLGGLILRLARWYRDLRAEMRG